MSELYFRLSDMKGFTSSELADKKEGYTNPIRELMQNSLDASRDVGKEECEINIYIETISKNAIPHINDYEKVLEKAIDTSKEQEGYTDKTQQIVKPIESALKQDALKVLMFSDDGIGMMPKKMNAILTGGISNKGNEESGGSFGVGHLSSYSLSSLRYVLYATKYKDENGDTKTLFTGSPILAGHRDEEDHERGHRGRIVKEKPEYEKGPRLDCPEEFPDFIKSKMEQIDTGTVVAILGLSEDWDIEAEYAIASNFFHGIAHDALKIKIHNENGGTKSIDIGKAEAIIASKKDDRRKKGGNILSGKGAYHALKAVIDGDQKTIILRNSDKVHVCIRTDKEADSAIVLVRNGMLIARHDDMLSSGINSLRKTSDFEPFTVVIDVSHSAPELLKLIRGAENPYHNKLKAKTLDNNNEKRLRKLLEELSEKIKEYLVKIDRDFFDLPLFSVPNKAEAKASGSNKSSGQSNKANRQPSRKKPPKPKLSKPNLTESKPPRPKPVVISRNLESTNAARYTDKGDKWEVKLRIVLPKIDDGDDVWLSICLGEDNDKEETTTYLDFIAIEINGQTIEMPDSIDVKKNGEWRQEPFNKSQIKLGKLTEGRSCKLIATVKKPKKIGDMKVALLPILGLKRRPNS